MKYVIFDAKFDMFNASDGQGSVPSKDFVVEPIKLKELAQNIKSSAQCARAPGSSWVFLILEALGGQF